MNYYNEFDPKAAEWLRQLIADERIPAGDVDTRSITDVQPSDLHGYKQCHFFAGIGGWSLALQLAGWPEDRPVWTGSCPCQPFSAAGKQFGESDPRHLWPQFHRLIGACQPSVVFGEQVASKAGRVWLAGVRADLETLAYVVGASDLCAAGVGAPQIRQRSYWVAYADRSCSGNPRDTGRAQTSRRADLGGHSSACGLGNADNAGSQGRDERGNGAHKWSPWAASVVLPCADGRSRRIEPGSFPLAHGVPGRVGLLRGYGNAIVPPLAAEFIQAADEAHTLTQLGV